MASILIIHLLGVVILNYKVFTIITTLIFWKY